MSRFLTRIIMIHAMNIAVKNVSEDSKRRKIYWISTHLHYIFIHLHLHSFGVKNPRKKLVELTLSKMIGSSEIEAFLLDHQNSFLHECVHIICSKKRHANALLFKVFLDVWEQVDRMSSDVFYTIIPDFWFSQIIRQNVQNVYACGQILHVNQHQLPSLHLVFI